MKLGISGWVIAFVTEISKRIIYAYIQGQFIELTASKSNTLLINLNMLEWSDINKNFYSGLGKGLYSVNEGIKWEE